MLFFIPNSNKEFHVYPTRLLIFQIHLKIHASCDLELSNNVQSFGTIPKVAKI